MYPADGDPSRFAVVLAGRTPDPVAEVFETTVAESIATSAQALPE